MKVKKVNQYGNKIQDMIKELDRATPAATFRPTPKVESVVPALEVKSEYTRGCIVQNFEMTLLNAGIIKTTMSASQHAELERIMADSKQYYNNVVHKAGDQDKKLQKLFVAATGTLLNPIRSSLNLAQTTLPLGEQPSLNSVQSQKP